MQAVARDSRRQRDCSPLFRAGNGVLDGIFNQGLKYQAWGEHWKACLVGVELIVQADAEPHLFNFNIHFKRFQLLLKSHHVNGTAFKSKPSSEDRRVGYTGTYR